MDAAAPSAVGPLQRVSYEDASAAAARVAPIFPGGAGTGPAWVASYGSSPEQIRATIYASKFADAVSARAAVAAIRTAIGAGQTAFKGVNDGSVAQQAGLKVDGEDRDYFVFARDSWVIWIEGMARDFDPVVSSIQWAPAR